MTQAPVSPALPRLEQVPLAPLLSIEADQSLWDAWQLLSLSGRRHLAVVDDEGRCLGVVADRAVLTDVPLTEDRLAGRSVREVMATPVPLTVEDSPREAARRMVDSSVDAIPMVDAHGRLKGMVTTSDLTRWLASH
jgi:CBS domain-containing protein